MFRIATLLLTLCFVPIQASSWLFIPTPKTGFANLHSGAFNGSSAYLDGGASSNLDIDVSAHAASFSVWICPTSVANTVIYGRLTGAPYAGIQIAILAAGNINLQAANNELAANYMNVSTPAASIVAQVNCTTAGNWYFLVVTTDGTGKAAGTHIYINASDQTLTVLSDTLSASTVSGIDYALGAGQVAVPVSFYAGNMDEFAVYNVALSSGTVTTLYNSGGPVTDLSGISGILTWLRFENNFTDSIGSNNATNTGVTFSTNVP